ncbi:hypothetical protein [Microbulbifer variabilis]|uniref:hypothetical protein n=1 Tax=Microbulbifer variabilis TaxID=266805 RepID=UPI001CFCBA12|nr:hypothetical protein [Microbulbifer variabilis]
MLRALLLSILFVVSAAVAAESVIVGTVEEIVVEDENFNQVQHLFSVKDEISGNYFFFNKKEVKGVDIKHGDRVSVNAEYKGSQIVEIRDIDLI